jgi:enoyl-CoA hydratase/carnithine racemase
MGRNITAQEAFTWGLVNKVVPQAEVVNEAVRYAAMIAANSPDAVMYMGWFEARIEERGSRAVEQVVEITLEREFAELQKSENTLEGLRAFVEKKPPKWVGGRS